MSFNIIFDEYSLEATVEALKTINPARAHSAEHIMDMVRANMWDGSTSMGTAGWEAAGFFPDSDPNTMKVRFALSAYSVNKYIESLNGDNHD